MPITQKETNELKQLHADHQKTYGGRYEDYFALHYLMKKFRRPAEDLLRQIAFGNNDYGVDAYHVDRETRNLYLYQFKWSENHNLFTESLARLATNGMQLIFGGQFQDPKKNEMLSSLYADLAENRELVNKVYVQFVFKGDVDKAEESQGLTNRKETLENKHHFVDEYFGRSVPLRVEFVSDRKTNAAPVRGERHKLSLTDRLTVEAPQNKVVMHVGFVPLLELHGVYEVLGQTFFDRNIRASLSVDASPNVKIREALNAIVIKGEVEPEVFAFNHNGVTLAAERVDFDGQDVTLHVPRLLNGAQTVSSAAKFLDDNQSNPQLKENRALLRRVKVLTRIVVSDPHGEFVTNVTMCNNRQNPVEPWHLRANDTIQCDLADRFREEAGIFYSRQENAFEAYTTEDLEELGITADKDVTIRALAQTFAASQGEVDRVSRVRDLFENQKMYVETFKQDYVKADVRRMVVAYKVGLILNRVMLTLLERCAQRHQTPVRRARNLVWALTIQAFFNDRAIAKYLDEYGTSLVKEAAFREKAAELAGSRVLPLLRDLFVEPNNAKKLEEEKYGFLKSKEAFKWCMSLAGENWDWRKLGIF